MIEYGEISGLGVCTALSGRSEWKRIRACLRARLRGIAQLLDE
jgi:hypothetical protein